MAKDSPEKPPPLSAFSRKAYYVFRALALVLCLMAIKKLLSRMGPQEMNFDLDDFQQLNSLSPVVEGSFSSYGKGAFLGVPAPEERAVVTVLHSEVFATGVLALGHSLRAANVSSRRILLYYPDSLIDRTMCYLQTNGWELHPLPRRQNRDDRFLELRLWTLDAMGIKSVVYLEADTLVRRNFDEIWTLPFQFAAVTEVPAYARPVSSKFSSGMMLLRTSTAVFNDMLSKRRDEGIQEFLNKYFAAQVVRLPYIYNADVAIKRRSPALWSAIADDMRILRYSVAKPFIEKERKRAAKDIWEKELKWWESTWLDTFKEIASKCCKC